MNGDPSEPRTNTRSAFELIDGAKCVQVRFLKYIVHVSVVVQNSARSAAEAPVVTMNEDFIQHCVSGAYVI